MMEEWVYDVPTTAIAEAPTPGELVERLNQLRSQKRSWHEAGVRLDKEMAEAESAIQRAMTFLKDGLEGNPQNGAVTIR